MEITCWLEKGYQYWEGKARPEAIAVEVPKRPSETHVWTGSEWADNSLGHYVYDKLAMCFVLRPAEEIAALEAERTKAQILTDNLVLVKVMKILLLELNAIRAREERPVEVTEFIDRVKAYL